jgi:Flp pilus assembly protein protease CpaA
MFSNVYLATAVLFVTVVALFYAAFIDLKHYKISNQLILLLIGLFCFYALLSDRWTAVAWNLGLAAGIFLFLIYFYTRHWMGGGDVKILTVSFLWTGMECALPFVILLLLFVFLHTVAAKFEWVESKQDANDGCRRIPFAPSIAAALIATILLGCLRSPD